MKKKFFNSAPPESNQDAFNKILDWLTRADASECVVENVNGSSGCMYRSADGNNACAIGVLMPTRLARSIDGAGGTGGTSHIVTVLDRYPTAKKWFAKCNNDFLSNMQEFHDDIMFKEYRSNSTRLEFLKCIAHTYKLKIPKDIVAFFSK
jgi:hypothetical protein